MKDVTEKFFSLFCSTWSAVLKMFVRLFRIRQLRALQNVQQELFKKTKNGETKAKRVLDNLRMP